MSTADHTEILIVGGGLAGFAAARRATQLGLSTRVVTETPGSLPYTSGALDLLGVYPTDTKRYRNRPWEALSELIERDPAHPYARVGLRGVRAAIDDFCRYLGDSALAYTHGSDENTTILTAAGTIKPTYAVPASIAASAEALVRRRPTLIVSFAGLPAFSAEMVVHNLRDRWPGLVATRIDVGPLLPGPAQRLRATGLADGFQNAAFRTRFVEAIQPRLGRARFVGLPAVLGHDETVAVCRELSELLGAEVFEIPLLSPSIPGQRLERLLERDVRAAGVDYLQGAPVAGLEFDGDGVTVRRLGRSHEQVYRADHVVLATGRFFGGGLVAGRDGVRETVLGVPVPAPASRDDWHMRTFLGAPGHPINRLGVGVDSRLRPVGADGRPLFEGVTVAGAVLAEHDWVREKSGAGISIATGYAAVDESEPARRRS